MHVGRRLAALRMELGLSQEEMARDLISRGHYSNIESGRYLVTEPFIDVLSNKLKIPVGYLLKHDYDNKYLRELLSELEYCLEQKDYKEAKWKIDTIKETFPFINSINQEFRYFLLLVVYYLLNNKIDEATRIVEKKIKIYISSEDEVPTEMQYLYYYTLALWYQQTNLLTISEEYYEKAYLFETSNIKKAKIEFNRALNNYQLHKLETSISFATRALDRFLEENMIEQVAKIYVMLGGMYWQLDMFEVAESVWMKGLEATKKTGDQDLEGKIYNNLGLIYDRQNDFEKSKEFYGKSIELKEKNKDSNVLISYINLLETLISYNKIEEALKLLHKVKKMEMDEEEKYHLLESEAKLHFLFKEYKEYEGIITEVIKYYKEKNYYKYLIPISQKYSEYLASKNKYKDAYLYLKETLQAKEHLEEKK